MPRPLVACVLIVCTLLVPLSLVSGIHHDDHSSHCCEFCHFGHVAWVQPVNTAQVLPSVHQEWRHSSEDSGRTLEHGETPISTRGPPAY